MLVGVFRKILKFPKMKIPPVITMWSHENITSLLALSDFRNIRGTWKITCLIFVFFFRFNTKKQGEHSDWMKATFIYYLKGGYYCVTENFFLIIITDLGKNPFLLLILLFTTLMQIQAASCSLREFWVKVSCHCSPEHIILHLFFEGQENGFL